MNRCCICGSDATIDISVNSEISSRAVFHIDEKGVDRPICNNCLNNKETYVGFVEVKCNGKCNCTTKSKTNRNYLRLLKSR